MQKTYFLKLFFVMLFTFAGIAGYGAQVENPSATSISSSNSVVINDDALLGVHTVLSLQHDKLLLTVINTATAEKEEKTLVRCISHCEKHGVSITGITEDNETVYISVNEVKGKDYLMCIISSANSASPLDVSYKSSEIGFGNDLQTVDFGKSYDDRMELVGNSKNSLKCLKQWVDKIPKSL